MNYLVSVRNGPSVNTALLPRARPVFSSIPPAEMAAIDASKHCNRKVEVRPFLVDPA